MARPMRVLGPIASRAELQAELALQTERNRIARERFDNFSMEYERIHRHAVYPGSDSDEEVHLPGVRRPVQRQGVMSFLSNRFGDSGNGSRRNSRRARSQREDSHMFIFLWYMMSFTRTHLKLLTIAATIVYFTFLLRAQADTDGWMNTRRLGYKQYDKCLGFTAEYTVKDCKQYDKCLGFTAEYTVMEDPYSEKESVATVFENDSSASDARDGNLEVLDSFEPCYTEEEFESLLDIFNEDSEWNEEWKKKYMTQQDLQDNVRNNGKFHAYFPSAMSILVFGYMAGILTLSVETFDGGNSMTSLASSRDRSFTHRINIAATLLLLFMLLVSSQYVTFLKAEDCVSSLGVTKSSDSLIEEVHEFCEQLQEHGFVFASLVKPTEGYVQSYRGTTLSLALTLLLSLIVKPKYSEGAPSLAQVLPGIFDTSDRRREPVQVRHGGGRQGDGTRLGERGFGTELFEERYNNVVKRNEMVKKWKLLNRLPKGSSEEEKNRCCTVCLEPLFVAAMGENEKDGGSMQSGEPVDLESNLGALLNVDPGTDSQKQPSEKTGSQTEDCYELPCGHRYHKPCILEWTLNNKTCPECRANLDGSSEQPPP